MAHNADKSQLPRLKAIFEKRNQKHNVKIQEAQVKRLQIVDRETASSGLLQDDCGLGCKGGGRGGVEEALDTSIPHLLICLCLTPL